MTDTCNHDKVYSGECFTSTDPMWAWVCRKCKETGLDQLGPGYKPDSNARMYHELVHVDPLKELEELEDVAKDDEPEGGGSIRA